MNPKRKPKKKPSGSPVRFIAEYVNRWGKLMRARDYGYKAWPIPVRGR